MLGGAGYINCDYIAGELPLYARLKTDTSQCFPGIQQIKKDRGALLYTRTFNAGNVAGMNFNAMAACP